MARVLARYQTPCLKCFPRFWRIYGSKFLHLCILEYQWENWSDVWKTILTPLKLNFHCWNKEKAKTGQNKTNTKKSNISTPTDKRQYFFHSRRAKRVKKLICHFLYVNRRRLFCFWTTLYRFFDLFVKACPLFLFIQSLLMYIVKPSRFNVSYPFYITGFYADTPSRIKF